MKAFVLLALILVACAPTEQDCRALMPIAGDTVVISTTPIGTKGCTTNVDGVGPRLPTGERRNIA